MSALSQTRRHRTHRCSSTKRSPDHQGTRRTRRSDRRARPAPNRARGPRLARCVPVVAPPVVLPLPAALLRSALPDDPLVNDSRSHSIIPFIGADSGFITVATVATVAIASGLTPQQESTCLTPRSGPEVDSCCGMWSVALRLL